MNERIQELAYQAEDYADGIADQGGEFHPAYTQKLAELIAKECAKVARNTDLEDVEGGDSAVLRAASEAIENYFGVK